LVNKSLNERPVDLPPNCDVLTELRTTSPPAAVFIRAYLARAIRERCFGVSF
jgi:hypothetical protein